MKIISFSLWGDKPMYVQGAFENIKLANEIYPGWKVRIYTDKYTNHDLLKKLNQAGAQIRVVEHNFPHWYNLFIRFLVNDDPVVTKYIVRDTDSRLSLREKMCVTEWESSNKPFHCMRDHPWHYGVKFLGGMWGCKTGVIPNISNLIEQYVKINPNFIKGIDQFFLQDMVWKYVKDNRIEHDSIRDPRHMNPDTKKFPVKRNNYEFVGCIFNEHNQRNDDYKGLIGINE